MHRATRALAALTAALTAALAGAGAAASEPATEPPYTPPFSTDAQQSSLAAIRRSAMMRSNAETANILARYDTVDTA